MIRKYVGMRIVETGRSIRIFGADTLGITYG